MKAQNLSKSRATPARKMISGIKKKTEGTQEHPPKKKNRSNFQCFAPKILEILTIIYVLTNFCPKRAKNGILADLCPISGKIFGPTLCTGPKFWPDLRKGVDRWT